ncbi:hypothetical protein [Xenorhabdus bovienii]|uniref:hypothetical protein n=1 Tax=Xenorhabdus bovienii TaxID=40576 RepID=UPI0021588B51|nr:hypothetical protein [Xenorhabdus bovienii]
MTEQTTCNKEMLKKMKDLSIMIKRANSLEYFTPRYNIKEKVISLVCFFLHMLILITGGYLIFLFLDSQFSGNKSSVGDDWFFVLANIFTIMLWGCIFSIPGKYVSNYVISSIDKKRETIATKKRNIYMETDDYYLFLEKKYNEIDDLLITYKPNDNNNFEKLQKKIKKNGFEVESILKFIHEEENSQDQEELKEKFKFLSKEI